MKTLLSTIAAVIFSICLHAQVNSNYTYVNGYYKNNGTYVEGYYRTTSNSTINDNYSTYPNINPCTGSQGTVKPEYNYNSNYYNNWSNSYYNDYFKSFYNSYTTPSYNYGYYYSTWPY